MKFIKKFVYFLLITEGIFWSVRAIGSWFISNESTQKFGFILSLIYSFFFFAIGASHFYLAYKFKNGKSKKLENTEPQISKKNDNLIFSESSKECDIDEIDPLYNEIIDYVIIAGKVSSSLLQRKYRLGFNRATRIINRLESEGIIGPQNGTSPRKVLISSRDQINSLNNINNNDFSNAIQTNNEDYLLYKIDYNMSGIDFEFFSKKLLQDNGFKNIEVTKSSNDYGADVTAEKDNVKYAIQCKKYSKPVGVEAIQEILASKTIYGCHVAVVLTNSTFTRNAQYLAKNNNILLWDRKVLLKMIRNTKKIDNYDKLREIKALYDENIITEEEFEQEKKKILNG